MSKQQATSKQKPGVVINPRLQDIQVKARFGHKDWIVWTEKDGTKRAEWRSEAVIKRALLASGTKGKWTLVCADCGTLMRGYWRLGINLFAQSQRGWA